MVDEELQIQLNKAKECKNPFDIQQILEKLPEKLREHYKEGSDNQVSDEI